MVLWIPAHVDPPKSPWRELWIPGSHFVSTGIGYVRALYQTTWSERAKRARKKFLSHPELRIERVSQDIFIQDFNTVRVRHAFKKEYISYYRSMSTLDPESIRSYVVYDPEDHPLAGLAVHDFDHTSIHLVAFTGTGAKKYQAGTGLVDRWYADSLEK